MGRDLAIQKLEQIDKIADDCNVGHLLYSSARAKQSDALAIADAIYKVKSQLDDQTIGRLLPLMNSSIGFESDSDKYDAETIRDCVCTAILSGYSVIGWEWGICNGKFHAKENGLRRKILEREGVTELNVRTGRPTQTKESGYAAVPVTVTLKLDGRDVVWDYQGDQAILVRQNQNVKVGADAAIAKARRKALKWTLESLAGYSVGYDDDDDDAIEGQVVSTHEADNDEPKQVDELFSKHEEVS